MTDDGEIVFSAWEEGFQGELEKLLPPEEADILTALALIVSESDDPLYSDEGAFPLPVSFIDDLDAFLPQIITSGDPPYRAKCELLARAFHGHRRGFDFLLWRSKTFKLPDPDDE